MNKSIAIKQYCSECCGESPSEVTFCPVVDCSLWPYRFGYSFKDNRFRNRMKSAKTYHPKDYDELLGFLKDHIQKHKNSNEIVQLYNLMCSL